MALQIRQHCLWAASSSRKYVISISDTNWMTEFGLFLTFGDHFCFLGPLWQCCGLDWSYGWWVWPSLVTQTCDWNYCQFCMTAWANQGPSLFKATDYVPHDPCLKYIFKHAFFHHDPCYPWDYCIIGISISFMGGFTKKNKKILGNVPNRVDPPLMGDLRHFW